jgi:hypothetical protein
MVTLSDFIKGVIETITHATTFKIGKTGQTIDDRFRGDHESNYKSIKEIGGSNNKSFVDGMEVELIKYFKTNHKNCDNEQEGGGDMCQSERYLIYVVWN